MVFSEHVVVVVLAGVAPLLAVTVGMGHLAVVEAVVVRVLVEAVLAVLAEMVL
jgi:hypothetical protein